MFVLNITNINFTFTLSDFGNKLEIHIQYEIIPLKTYYNTIGRYKLLLKNICTNIVHPNYGKFDFNEIEQIAEDLSVNISGLSQVDICNVLTSEVYNLKLRDFDL